MKQLIKNTLPSFGRHLSNFYPLRSGATFLVMENQICSICNIEKKVSEFYIDRSRKIGITRCCIICQTKNRHSKSKKICNTVDGEIWKDSSELNGKIQISNMGNARTYFSLKYKRENPIYKAKSDCGNGYLSVSANGKRYLVHRLVAKEFIPNPENKPNINHKNMITTDNRVENLEWVTQYENIQYSLKYGGKKIHRRKLIGIRISTSEKIVFENCIDAQNYIGCTHNSLVRCLYGKRKTIRGFVIKEYE